MNKRLRDMREWLYVTIFEHYTTAGRAFDVALIAAIVLSVAVVMLDSVSRIQTVWGGWLSAAEWFFTFLFTIEYLLRIACARRPLRYMGSFFGMVDLLAILPSYASLFFPGYRFLVTIRILRILRVFRILKLAQYVGEADILWLAIKSSGRKITVFITTVLTIVVIVGSLMFFIEGAEAGFSSIPKSIYWAIVTMTTVGYGDIAPRTPLGQGLASMLMIVGYGIIAVPTGIVTVELSRSTHSQAPAPSCPACGNRNVPVGARFCPWCGDRISDIPPDEPINLTRKSNGT